MNATLSYSGTYHFTWEVPDFFDLSLKSGEFLQSAEFCVAGDLYCLRLYPYGTPKAWDCDIFVDILLVRLTFSAAKKDISYEIQYKSSTGVYYILTRYINCPVESVGGDQFSVERSKLEKNIFAYVPNGKLTVCCRILGELSVLPLHGEDEKKGSPGFNKLQSDFKRLMLKGAESDACLVVCGKEFQTHKCVLRARSPVFDAMFHHETTEKESGRVVIDDLKPDHFQGFLEYLYTGRVEAFSEDNAFGLYATADKYDVTTLKSECVEYMRRSLSVDSVCDVITLALRYHEEDLMALAVEFFKKNLTSILLTVKWQRFMSENSTGANEILIKALVPGK